jgi:hypothetical protein
MKKRVKEKRSKGWIFWTPRILSIIFILFLALFSLDVFDGNPGFWGIVLGLFMHNIPSILLLIVLLISWRHEIVGGLVFILAGLLYIAILLITILTTIPHPGYMLFWSLLIAGPAFFIGILFLIGWFRKRKKNKN